MSQPHILLVALWFGCSHPNSRETADATGSSADAAADGTTADASMGTGCGGTCRSGESCVANACVYATCTGASVPGDYATVQAAVSALEGAGGTICLGPQGYAEGVTIDAGTHALVISGVSAATTSVESFHITQTGAFGGTIAIQGLSTTNVTASFGGTLNLTNIIASSATGPVVSFDVGYLTYMTMNVTASTIAATGVGVALDTHDGYVGSDGMTMTLDGVDLSSVSSAALDSDQLELMIKSSYIHDSPTGITGNASPATFVNNTFARDTTAVTWGSGGGPTVFNNLFVGNHLALEIDSNADLPTTQFGANAFWQNTTSFAGHAMDATDDVKTDPLLDIASPPGLGAGSPCRGAADSGHAPQTDFWGTPRGNSPDIGAVQMP